MLSLVKVLVAYGTVEGQARKIADYVADRLRGRGLAVDVIDVAAARDVARDYDAAVLSGSIHVSRHPRALTRFARANCGWLNAMPTLFLSISLSVASRSEQTREAARQLAARFQQQTGFVAGSSACIAGALRYSQYHPLKRFVMRRISRAEGRETDTSRDYEYTDWQALAAQVDAFAATLAASVANR